MDNIIFLINWPSLHYMIVTDEFWEQIAIIAIMLTHI